MSERIKPGDLVQVVRGHSCALDLLGGFIFVVRELLPAQGGGWTCPRCGERDIGKYDSHGATGYAAPIQSVELPYRHLTTGTNSLPLSFLKRIPPIEEMGDVKRDEEITA